MNPRPKPDALTAAAACLILFGIALRTVNFTYPQAFIFDEHHFVENARNYLAGRADWNDHPPLGKLLIALSMKCLGDTALAWRLPAWIAGVLTMGLAALALGRLFKSRHAALLGAAFLSVDGFFISYSRVGLLDGMLVTCAALALVLTTLDWRPWVAVAAGVVAGSACNIKFSGVAIFPVLLFSIATAPIDLRRKVLLGFATVAVSLGVYVAFYALGLSLSGQPSSPMAVLEATKGLVAHHAGLTEMKHPSTSAWPTWFLPTKPILMARFPNSGGIRALTTLGNLALWWPGVAVTLGLGWQVLRLGGQAAMRSTPPAATPGFLQEHGRAVLTLLLGAAAFLAPWALSRRDSYVYHFLPSYFFVVVTLAALAGWLAQRSRLAVLCYVVLVGAVAAAYAPVWSLWPISTEALEARLFFSGWRQ